MDRWPDAQETVLKVLDKFPCLEVVIATYDYYSPWQNKAKSPLTLMNWAACPSMRVALFSANDKHTPFCKMPLKVRLCRYASSIRCMVELT